MRTAILTKQTARQVVGQLLRYPCHFCKLIRAEAPSLKPKVCSGQHPIRPRMGVVKLYVELLGQSVDGLLGQTTRDIAAVALERVITNVSAPACRCVKLPVTNELRRAYRLWNRQSTRAERRRSAPVFVSHLRFWAERRPDRAQAVTARLRTQRRTQHHRHPRSGPWAALSQAAMTTDISRSRRSASSGTSAIPTNATIAPANTSTRK